MIDRPGTTRCVYVCAGLHVTTSAVARTLALVDSCVAMGHSVTVLLDQPVARSDVVVKTLAAPRPEHLYFCDEQSAADRVFDTIGALDWTGPPGSVYFVDCAEVALTTLRARRYLYAFPGTSIVAVTGDSTEAALGSDPRTLAEVFWRWAVRYGLAHVDAVTNPTDLTHFAGPRVAPTQRSTSVSVVIPLFNQGNYLQDAVASAREQGVPDLEIVVVNDGSTDPQTNQAFEQLRGVRKIAQANRGLSAARNAGIRHASGEYVVTLDADDELMPGFVTTARDALDRHLEIGYLTSYAHYTGLLDHVYVPAGFIPEVNLFLHTNGKAVGMYRRAALLAVGGYDEDFTAFEDWELQVALHRAGYLTDVIPCLGQTYRRHLESMTFTKSNAMRDQLIQQLIRKHVAMLSPEELRTGLLILSHFWKNGYEPSTSVALQRRLGPPGSTS